ncbi:zf-HC2 domain-containing protein [Vulgatibacter incomptus]|uniref:Putative transmembrane protein n=1 Tax=Vulgatibacter incomptus TaxID=1391653 RepID=A0A0K1PEX6_9BACT|nr:zf-HC2 domain-containing protein [Vulgatibacter incomptus]AKU91669.1 putative transmembrane protein [Vulgatibacter incomptus]
MECRDLERLLPAYADGEFASSESAEAELHLSGCPDCRDQVARQLAFRAFLQARASETRAEAPGTLRARIRKDIAKERAVENLRRFAAYSAVAAGLVVVASTGYVVAGKGVSETAPMDVVLDAIDKHSRALPVEVTPASTGDVSSWFRGKVDFNVSAPTFSSPTAPRLVGARLANVKDRQAAYLVYGGDEPSKRMTLLVFPGGDVHLPDGHRKHVGGHDVVIANERGYNVALWEKKGIVYSLVSDLDENDVFQLVSQVEDR